MRFSSGSDGEESVGGVDGTDKGGQVEEEPEDNAVHSSDSVTV